MATFPDRLKELRKAKGFTQKAMSEFLGITEQAYQKYEYNMREPNHETTIKIADFFVVSVDYLLGRANHWVDSEGHIVVKMPPDILNLNTDTPKPDAD